MSFKEKILSLMNYSRGSSNVKCFICKEFVCIDTWHQCNGLDIFLDDLYIRIDYDLTSIYCDWYYDIYEVYYGDRLLIKLTDNEFEFLFDPNISSEIIKNKIKILQIMA